jgi:RimJ/RimL family protein N-acetyltransferase
MAKRPKHITLKTFVSYKRTPECENCPLMNSRNYQKNKDFAVKAELGPGVAAIHRTTVNDSTLATASAWRAELPVLAGRLVTLREATTHDLGALFDLLSASDATRFGLDEPVTEFAVQHLIDRAARDRAVGTAFTYVIILSSARTMAGVIQVRQLEPTFEAAEWECTLAASSRGTGVFLEAARLAGSLAFGTVGAHRLEARVLLKNGRANGALRKLGAVQEGVLRRSVRRQGDYVDQVLWSMLKEDWGDHWMSTAPRVH